MSESRTRAKSHLERSRYTPAWDQDPVTGGGPSQHVYVHPDARGSGVGRELVSALVERARVSFHRVRLRGVTPRAPAFYASIGFSVTAEDDATHEMRF